MKCVLIDIALWNLPFLQEPIQAKKIQHRPELHITDRLWGKPQVIIGFPSLRASNAANPTSNNKNPKEPAIK